MESQPITPNLLRLTRALILAVLLTAPWLLMTPGARGQSGGDIASTSADPEAARLIELLRRRPDLMAQLKSAGGRRPTPSAMKRCINALSMMPTSAPH